VQNTNYTDCDSEFFLRGIAPHRYQAKINLYPYNQKRCYFFWNIQKGWCFVWLYRFKMSFIYSLKNYSDFYLQTSFNSSRRRRVS